MKLTHLNQTFPPALRDNTVSSSHKKEREVKKIFANESKMSMDEECLV